MLAGSRTCLDVDLFHFLLRRRTRLHSPQFSLFPKHILSFTG
ncbi:hypothetical protein BVRB_1g002460 [Beta vulgaris subsp. vulgaris]|nr:hypothetical protein BVRB_1g002460 [Beta vulgaris subsp. vulgaris]